MARARNIKPGFFKNEDLAECSPWARLCFAGLWTLADREGRLEDRPKRIKGELFAFDSVDVEQMLTELEGRGFLVRYRNLDGSFIQIYKFLTHQSPHYSEKDSVIKPPELPESAEHQDTEKPATSKKVHPIKRGSQPPDSLIPDSPNPDSLNNPPGVLTDTAPPLETLSPETPPPKPKPAKTPKPEPVPIETLIAAGLDEQTAAEFVAHKAAVKAPLTPRAWADHQREAAKAGWTAKEAAEKVLAKQWKGFESTYVANESRPVNGSHVPTFRERDEARAAERFHAMTGNVLRTRQAGNQEFDDAVFTPLRVK